jgi:hypothetical protein
LRCWTLSYLSSPPSPRCRQPSSPRGGTTSGYHRPSTSPSSATSSNRNANRPP